MYLKLIDIDPDGQAFDHRLELPDLRGDSGEPLAQGPVRIHGAVSKGSRGFDLAGEIQGTVRLQCSRCLELFDRTLAVSFDLVLVGEEREPAVRGESELKAEDARLFYTEAGKADLRAIATEQIHLELPLKPMCGDECRGLCPACGANRNRIECGCPSDDVDPRFASLRELRDRMGGR